MSIPLLSEPTPNEPSAHMVFEDANRLPCCNISHHTDATLSSSSLSARVVLLICCRSARLSETRTLSGRSRQRSKVNYFPPGRILALPIIGYGCRRKQCRYQEKQSMVCDGPSSEDMMWALSGICHVGHEARLRMNLPPLSPIDDRDDVINGGMR
jgi:hypothetical protein